MTIIMNSIPRKCVCDCQWDTKNQFWFIMNPKDNCPEHGTIGSAE